MVVCAATMPMKLSMLSKLLGLGMAALNLFGLIKPAGFAAAARKFPRSLPLGYLLMLLGTAWFIWNVNHESLADFEGMKPFSPLITEALDGRPDCKFCCNDFGLNRNDDFLGFKALD